MDADSFFESVQPPEFYKHKGDNGMKWFWINLGIVLVVGGSDVYSGAPFFSAKGALLSVKIVI